MKTTIYVVAALAAAGIAFVLMNMPTDDSQAAPASAEVATSLTSNSEVLDEAGSLTLEVPGMHCQFACFPRVKDTLEGAAGVTEVELAEQPDPASLTVKKVIVKYDAGFDVGEALASLRAKGFQDASKIQ